MEDFFIILRFITKASCRIASHLLRGRRLDGRKPSHTAYFRLRYIFLGYSYYSFLRHIDAFRARFSYRRQALATMPPYHFLQHVDTYRFFIFRHRYCLFSKEIFRRPPVVDIFRCIIFTLRAIALA